MRLSTTSILQSPAACSFLQLIIGHVNPCNLFGVIGYEMLDRKCSSGTHALQIVFPHGMVTGSRKGYEQVGHCMNLTICRASLEGSRCSLGSVIFGKDGLGVFESGGGRVSAALRGKEDDIETLRPAKAVK